MRVEKGKFYQHMLNRDIAFKVILIEGWIFKVYYGAFYNVNYNKVSGNPPLFLYNDCIKMKRGKWKEYKLKT